MWTYNGHISHSVQSQTLASTCYSLSAHAKLSVKNKYSEVVSVYLTCRSSGWLPREVHTKWPSFKEDVHAFMHACGTAIS
ncbi:hypothetical protein NP493_568g00024 [Ridgeia piscesae]|uniref:Uncharacterized protein n=1 Tax=Ridgeia piscesae TaxID=27915 RepID=A0AAD9J1X3_RIDPI|nr:hypothetical protein NP493_4049g00023 [Ridgeia piscesae]KAK2145050.1 hypothetical protein NP493_4049g00019 [Ridgeia piscesae]KAK2177992.1 hypothetical protein NP493_568g00024 [Ridgeia piscesae]